MATIARNTMFTNVGETSDGGVWWEGLDPPPAGVTLTDWHGKSWKQGEQWDRFHHLVSDEYSAVLLTSFSHLISCKAVTFLADYETWSLDDPKAFTVEWTLFLPLMPKGSSTPCAHPNSRFCAPAGQCPIIDPRWESEEGVPIDAIIFGGRRPEGLCSKSSSVNDKHLVAVRWMWRNVRVVRSPSGLRVFQLAARSFCWSRNEVRGHGSRWT